MLELLVRVSRPVETHLLYASIVWLAAWLLTAMPRGSATTKYWIWVATSVNFLLPLSLVPERFWPSPVAWFAPGNLTGGVENNVLSSTRVLTMFWVVWASGSLLMLVRLYLRVRAARLAHRMFPAPAVDGLLLPHISIPDGIDRLLTRAELDAVLIHERIHARRRDNLIGAIQEIALCALWFHPFLWIAGSRLALYRELSCDESVIDHARGADLVSALAKLADGGNTPLLRATASSFISRRLDRLTAVHAPSGSVAANAILSVAFAAIVLAAVLGPVAKAAASAGCARTHAQGAIGRGN
jgi:Zn-dependent protease with chaperone function